VSISSQLAVIRQLQDTKLIKSASIINYKEDQNNLSSHNRKVYLEIITIKRCYLSELL